MDLLAIRLAEELREANLTSHRAYRFNRSMEALDAMTHRKSAAEKKADRDQQSAEEAKQDQLDQTKGDKSATQVKANIGIKEGDAEAQERELAPDANTRGGRTWNQWNDEVARDDAEAAADYQEAHGGLSGTPAPPAQQDEESFVNPKNPERARF